jgi:hypothetical protein
MNRLVIFALFAGASGTASADLLYSIGGTGSGQPSRVTAIDHTSNSAPVFDLDSATAAFSGLTYDSADGLLYSVMNDPGSPSQLVRFSLADGGAFSAVMPLDPGGLSFNGGLAYDPASGNFYAMANNYSWNSVPYRIAGGTLTPLTRSLPCTFNGGLTVTGSGLASICNDSDANSYLYNFTLSGDVAAVSGAPTGLGQGYFGGLFQDGGLMYTLNSDPAGASYLNGGAAPFGVGNGFANAGLTGVPSAVPEPGAFTLTDLALSGAALALCRALRRARPI